jgi:hypothetical protein
MGVSEPFVMTGVTACCGALVAGSAVFVFSCAHDAVTKPLKAQNRIIFFISFKLLH